MWEGMEGGGLYNFTGLSSSMLNNFAEISHIKIFFLNLLFFLKIRL